MARWTCNECDSEPSDDIDGYCNQCRDKLDARQANMLFRTLNTLRLAEPAHNGIDHRGGWFTKEENEQC